MQWMWSWIRTAIYNGYDIFFRARLLVLNSEQISDFIDQLDNEVSNIRKESLKLAWSMRGGVNYNDILNMSFAERELIADISKENLEVTKKSGLPFF